MLEYKNILFNTRVNRVISHGNMLWAIVTDALKANSMADLSTKISTGCILSSTHFQVHGLVMFYETAQRSNS